MEILIMQGTATSRFQGSDTPDVSSFNLNSVLDSIDSQIIRTDRMADRLEDVLAFLRGSLPKEVSDSRTEQPNNILDRARSMHSRLAGANNNLDNLLDSINNALGSLKGQGQGSKGDQR